MTKKKKTPVAPSYHGMSTALLLNEMKFVTKVGKTNLYGGSIYTLSEMNRVDLVIDLSGVGTTENTFHVDGNAAARNLLPKTLFYAQIPILSIACADGAAPTMHPQWWQELVAAIRAMPVGSNVAVCCVGGTGRTGTALAIIAALAHGAKGEHDPVLWLRKRYDTTAVESEAQMWYVEDMTGLRSKEWPSDYLWSVPATDPLGKKGNLKQGRQLPQGVVTGPLGSPA